MPYFYGTPGNDTMTGTAQADTLVPLEGADIVNAGAGDDRIELREDGQTDILTGGSGADLYFLEQGGVLPIFGAYDRITDFNIAEGDRIQFQSRQSPGAQAYLRWAGAITDPQFTLALGDLLPAGDPQGGAFWSWQSGGRTYLVIDNGTVGVIDRSDFILAFDGLINLGPEAFTPETFIAVSGTIGDDAWTGGPANDIYQGLLGDDVVDGGGGNDELLGGRGADRLSGGDGNDLLLGNEGDDVLMGGAGNDTLYAAFNYTTGFSRSDTGSTNRLFGGEGDDTLVGGSGTDFLDGGAGNDLLSAGTDLAGAAQDTLTGGAGDDLLVMNGDIGDGGDGNDTIRFGSVASRMTGGAGADLFVTAGNQANFQSSYSLITDFDAAAGDRLDLGARFSRPAVVRGALDNPQFSMTAGARFSTQDYGAGFIQIWTWTNGGVTNLMVDLDGNGVLSAEDYVLSFTGKVTLTDESFTPGNILTLRGATMGDDLIIGTAGTDILYGLNGDDRIEGVGGSYDELNGGNGNDLLIAGTGSGTLYGDAGDDRLESYDGFDTLVGGAGSDVIYGRGGNDRLYGADTRVSAGADAPGDVNLLFGGAGDDSITGGGLNDRLYGEDGNDSIYGAGYLDGGAGRDSLSAGAGRGYLLGGEGDDGMRGGAANDFISGGEGVDNFHGDVGDDVIVAEMVDLGGSGGDGDDLFLVGGFQGIQINSLQIYGQDGADTVDLGAADRRITVDLGVTAAQDIGGGLRLTLGTIENVRGGDYGSILTGTAGANRLTGGDGDDVLTGGSGDDELIGGRGFDTAVFSRERAAYTLTARDGLLIVQGPDGTDTLSGIQRLQFSDGVVEGLVDASGAGISRIGGAGIDVLLGSDNGDRLSGGGDNDALVGGAGADILQGGGGSDIIGGGSGVDTAVYGGMIGSYSGVSRQRVSGGEEGGADTLSGVEILRFLDGRLSFDVNDATTVVYRLYDAAFDRAPDVFGLADYARAIQEGRATVQGILDVFAGSAEFQARYGALNNEQFVREMYRFSLNREGDAAGVAQYVNALNAGTTTRAQVLGIFSESQEHRSLINAQITSRGLFVQDEQTASVARLYDSVFNRLPDLGGLKAYRDALDDGFTLKDIAAVLVGSPEFQTRFGALTNQQFVEQIYRFVLDREGDTAGVQAYVTALNNGASRTDVVLVLSESQEHRFSYQATFDNQIRQFGVNGYDPNGSGVGRAVEETFDKLHDALVLPDDGFVPVAHDDGVLVAFDDFVAPNRAAAGDVQLHVLDAQDGLPDLGPNGTGTPDVAANHHHSDWM